MQVLLIGGGGREHALADAISRSPLLTKLIAAPGNPGIAEICDCVTLPTTDGRALVDFCRLMSIDLVVVGPEVPLVEGVADVLTEAGIPVFGPSAAAARLEGSKAFTKAVCDEADIPTARWQSFQALDPALEHVRSGSLPVVIKADGLAAGKGVTVATDRAEAEAALRDALHGEGSSVVIEEFLEGDEASVFVLCDGADALPLPPCQDHKRIGEGDTGPNTGGMGALCPAPVVSQAVLDRTMSEIVHPTLRVMRDRGTPFRGVLYAGLMIKDGAPKLIEYNVRFGDPEAQVLLPLMGRRTLELLRACATGSLADMTPPTIEGAALCVTLAEQGYPGKPNSGNVIGGIAEAEALSDTRVFHAGTSRDPSGDITTSGGRVLTVVGLGDDLRTARDRAYDAVHLISWPGMQFRRDIGWRALGD